VWSKLSDELIDHPKIFAAGDQLAQANGPALAMAMFTVGLLWSNKQLSDGFVPSSVIRRFPHFENPLDIARALVTVHLWDAADDGYRIRHFHDWNFTAKEVNARRRADRDRKRVNGRKGGIARHGIR
jgi:hypothetical protein